MYRALQRQLILWTLFLVVALGAVEALICLQPLPNHADLFMSPAFSQRQKATHSSQSRVPASQELSTAAREDADEDLSHNGPKSMELQFDCVDRVACVDCGSATPKLEKVDSSVTQIRLSGAVCENHEDQASFEIVNEANGTSATIFYPNAATFTTDYLTLAPGQNKIKMLQNSKDGKTRTQDFIIERTALKSSN